MLDCRLQDALAAARFDGNVDIPGESFSAKMKAFELAIKEETGKKFTISIAPEAARIIIPARKGATLRHHADATVREAIDFICVSMGLKYSFPSGNSCYIERKSEQFNGRD